MKPETMAIHTPNSLRDGAVAAPIHLSTTFEHGPANESLHGFEYIRDGNPNVNDLETRLAAIEGGTGAIAFSSGMAAGAALLSTLKPGSEVLFHNDLYMDFRNLSEHTLSNWNIKGRVLDLRNEQALKKALSERTALIWFETPSNPKLDIIDIKSISAHAATAGVKTLVDGTFASPALQKPLELGADYVLHSLTKYMGGHSDVQGGAIVVKDQTAVPALMRVRKLTGGVLAPFNAWMVSRGLQTLYCRMERHSSNALAVAEMLSQHPKTECVHYPYLKTNPAHEIAKIQMSAGGGMVSFEVKGGRDAALTVAAAMKLFLNATSLGGVESLVEHRASVEGPSAISPQGLLRLSIGLEHIDDLIEDLEQALAAI